MNKSSKQVFNNLIEYVCFSEPGGTIERCHNGIFPECNCYGFGCYELLRETRDKFDKLDDIKKIVGGENNDK